LLLGKWAGTGDDTNVKRLISIRGVYIFCSFALLVRLQTTLKLRNYIIALNFFVVRAAELAGIEV
jgi:hypothetical protein